jgi:hypothetical protein
MFTKLLKLSLCISSLGFVHYEGKKNLGMYGDAARCDTCKMDRYGLIVLHEVEDEQSKT